MPNRLVQSRIIRVIAGGINPHGKTRAILAAGLLGLVVATGFLTAMPRTAVAATGINKQINFQGKVTNTNGTNVANGTYTFDFKIYTVSSGGSAVWTETKSLTVTDGIFQTALGSSTSLPGSIDFNTDNIYLGITFNGDPEMSPRIQFTATPYSFNSDLLDGLDASAFAQLNPGSAQSGSLNVTGTVQAATSLQAPVVDTASAAALAIGGTNATSVTVGKTTTALTLQGNASSVFTATNGANTTTVGFTTPTGNNAITFPDAGGTVCTTTATTCSATYQTVSPSGSFVQLAPATAQADSSTNTSIFVNKTGASGNLLDLQVAAASKLTLSFAGDLSQASGSSTTNTINGQRISSAANFTGTVTAATSLLAPLLDTASAGTLALGTTSATAIALNQNTTVLTNKTFTANGSALFQPATDTTSAFNIKTSAGNNQFTVDTTTGRIGISLSSSNVPTLQGQGLEINGALRLSGGGGSTYADTFTTPVGSSVDTKINIPLYNPGNFGQLVAMGLPSTASTSSRALSLFDARTVAHQPTLGVFSPDEQNLIGFSWDGSNTQALLKSTGSDIAINANAINVARFENSGGNAQVTLGANAVLQASPSNKLDITANAASTWSTTSGNLTVDSAAALQLGTSTATSLSVGRSAVTTTVNGVTQLGASAGSGALVNNGTTTNTTLALGDLAAGALGTAAATVDIYTGFSIAPTASGRTYTIPTPTASTAYGRTIYISNIASASNSFILLGTTMNPGATATLVWANTSGGASWQFAGADGNGILNQNTADQTADFRISGTGRANTSFVAPAFDSISGGAGTLTLGAANASAITLGNTSSATVLRLQGGSTGGIQLGSGAGQGYLQNNGSTINTTLALGDLAAGSIGANTATVDIYTSFSIAPTASGRTYTIPTPTASTNYGRLIYVSNIAASGNSFIIGGATINPGATATLVWSNTSGGASWQFAGADAGNLQSAYNNSLAGTTPDILVNSTKLGVTIQNANTSGLAAGAELFGVRSAVSGDTLATSSKLFTVTSYGAAINLGTTSAAAGIDLQFGSGANRVLAVNDQPTAATAGNKLTVRAAAGNTSGVGGDLELFAGAGGNTAAGGNVSVKGGAAGGGNTAGGTANLQGGTASGSGTGGQTNVTGGAANPTTGSGSAGGAVAIAGAAGAGTATGGSAGGAGGAITIAGGAGGSAASGTLQGGVGGGITISGGNGGTSSGAVANVNGGGIRLTAGAAGTGGSGAAGVPGVVSIDQAVFTNTNVTYTQSANNQSFPTAGAQTTTMQSNVDSFSTISITMAGAFTGATITIPAPSNTTAVGRVLYISNPNASTASYTLSSTGMKSVLLGVNSTAVLVWNGTYWASSASATSLQDVYNNTSSSPAGIITTSATKNILFQAGVGFDNANVFQIGNSSGATIFTVDTTNTATGTNLAVNGAAESVFAGEWVVNPGSGGSATVTRTTTAAELATGLAAVKVATNATNGTSSGVRNALGAALAVSTKYNVSFSVKSSDAWGNSDIAVEYYRNNTPTLDATCSAFTGTYVPTINATTWIKYNCSFTTSATTGASTAYLTIRQTAAATRNFFIDNLNISAQNNTGTQDVGALRVGGALSQGLNLLTLDSYASAPFSGVNATLLGSMYYDTTQGRIQCYEQDGWGPCGSAPNNSYIMVPEYTSAVLSVGTGTDTHIGTMTANMCSGSSRFTIQPTEGTICAAAEEYNYYRWTSGQTSTQTYSIFVKYQLPPTFNNFLDANTIQAVGRISSTTDAALAFGVYGNTGTQCGSTTTIASSANTWTTTSLGGSSETSCGFVAGDIITFKIDMSSRNNAYAYVSNLMFTMTGK